MVRKILTVVGMMLSLISCDTLNSFSQKLITSPLRNVKQMIVLCEYERAIDISQRFTVMGNSSEKWLAYQFLSIAYLEKNALNTYHHTIDRFLFSVRDRQYSKAEMINRVNIGRQEIVELRVEQLGFSECAQKRDEQYSSRMFTQ